MYRSTHRSQRAGPQQAGAEGTARPLDHGTSETGWHAGQPGTDPPSQPKERRKVEDEEQAHNSGKRRRLRKDVDAEDSASEMEAEKDMDPLSDEDEL